ncbi:MAG: endopeptidase La [Eubacteriales bacterium]|nr:endopeptidase La [Eubacteriales bacterium]
MTILPVFSMVTVPDSNVYYRTDQYKHVAGKDPEVDEALTLVVSKREVTLGELTPEDIYPIGVRGYITEVNDQGYIVIHLTERVDLSNINISPEGIITLTSETSTTINDLDEDDAERRIGKIKGDFMELSKKFQWGQMFRVFVSGWKTLGDIAAAVSPWMNFGNEEYYALLAEDSDRKRFDMMESMLYEYMELTRVKLKVQTVQEADNQKRYREQAIRSQIDYLQKELGDLNPDAETETQKLEKKINESGMNDEARREAQKLLNRLKAEGENSHESGMLVDYLEFITSLPWKKEAAKDIALDQAEAILNEDHFGLEKVKKRILEHLAVMDLTKKQAGSILLFVGAPGTGKTSIGQSIARALGREYVRVSLGGVKDEADIRGHRRTYIGAMPGRILDGIQKSGVSNPVMVLDEIDKLSMSYNGDPASALLEVLDPEQNNTFTDHYLNVPYDLSDVMFICTANTVDTIPAPLLNRMELIQFNGYTPVEKLEIAKRHLLPKAMKAAGLADGDLSMPDDVISKVIDDYTREAGVRGLKKRMDMICRSAAVQIVKGSDRPIGVTEDNLRDFMDIRPLHQKHVRDSAQPGVVTGLAWTAVGGVILYIETRKTKGKGQLTITGQLGSVMKESVQIAYTLVKSIYEEKAEEMENYDIHIHVPDGATPKDGPSAGITITTALASLVTGIPVDPHVAMTGEVSLQGSVNPIGGLPEKLMAAQRAGVKLAFIPQDNVDDLEDVAQEVKDNLEIVPVSAVSDVLSRLDLLPAKPTAAASVPAAEAGEACDDNAACSNGRTYVAI